MKGAWLRLGLALLLGWPLVACEEPAPEVERPALQALRPYTFRNAQQSDSCVWVLNYEGAGERVVGRGDSLRYVFREPGSYSLGSKVYKGRIATLDIVDYRVEANSQRMAPTLHRVLEYRPAPGQFVNKLPLFAAGDDAAAMALKAEMHLKGEMPGQQLVTLGAYGGYLIFAFDHAVLNRPDEYDFKVLGNALRHGAEPGCVRVGVDWNENGRPDPWEWYELAGSAHHRPETIRDYAITYTRDTTHSSDALNRALTDSTYIPWDDNQGQRGWVSKNRYHSQSYWPQWIAEPQITFGGVRLPDNYTISNSDFTNPQYSLRAFPWGYVDNVPEQYSPGFKIEWAVDRSGRPIHLHAIDFVMVYTGVNQYCGQIGETSTEVQGAIDLNL